MSSSLVIIGAGACGLVAAIEAAKKGLKVTVFEKNSKVGRKILATGNGRCNISNNSIKSSNYHSQNSFFVEHTITQFDTRKAIEYFRNLSLEMIEGENGRLYPMNHQASTVVEMLYYECQYLGVKFCLNQEVIDIKKAQDKFQISTKEAHESFDICMIATGGSAMSKLGGSASGYKLASAFGHKIISTYPSLVQLTSDDKEIKELSGVKVAGAVEIWIDKQKSKSASGDILFTNYGVSGSAILDISRDASLALLNHQSVFLILDLMSAFSKDKLEVLLSKRLKHTSDKSIILWLEGVIHKKLVPFVVKNANLNGFLKASTLGQKELKKLAYSIKNVKVFIDGTKGLENAEVTAGGICVDEINPKTYESKIVKNLYFGGEVLDVDGDCGGYNLHFAWASGYMVGNAVG